jgi:mRNA interferase RelE/StbE
LTAGANQELERLPKVMKERVLKMLKRLEGWPTVGGVKRLSGNLAGYYRARVGDYRLRFRVEGDRVIVNKIGHRKDVYES